MKDPTKAAIREAKRKIRVLSGKALESNLSAFCGSLAEAYEAGVWEAQNEIVSRLQELEAKRAGKSGGTSHE